MTARTKRTRPDPWAHIAEKLQAEAREFNELRNQIGLEFRSVQQQSMGSWCEWMDELDEEENTKITTG